MPRMTAWATRTIPASPFTSSRCPSRRALCASTRRIGGSTSRCGPALFRASRTTSTMPPRGSRTGRRSWRSGRSEWTPTAGAGVSASCTCTTARLRGSLLAMEIRLQNISSQMGIQSTRIQSLSIQTLREQIIRIHGGVTWASLAMEMTSMDTTIHTTMPTDIMFRNITLPSRSWEISIFQKMSCQASSLFATTPTLSRTRASRALSCNGVSFRNPFPLRKRTTRAAR
mmetsp:Transcript_141396/g.439444  ORF Transcript_141396/g.439444 Transcript_141396/m.439444 type:complete len:228 (+) Transcript_141396:680-1363(+)